MLTLYHAPKTRAFGVLWLLEELGVPYRRQTVDIRTPESVPESYRAIQPNKKVPAIVHDGIAITERAAIVIHLADAFPEAGLAPPIGDSRRGPYLSMLVYADAVFDPALAARALGWSYDKRMVSFGSFDDMVEHLDRLLSRQDFAVGDRFTAADTQLGTGIHWALNILGVMPDRPAFRAYLDRVTARPAFRRTVEIDQG